MPPLEMNKIEQYKLVQEWLTSGFQLFKELGINDKKAVLDTMYVAVRDYRHDTLLRITDFNSNN